MRSDSDNILSLPALTVPIHVVVTSSATESSDLAISESFHFACHPPVLDSRDKSTGK